MNPSSSLDEIPEKLREVFAPDSFRESANQMVEILCDYLQQFTSETIPSAPPSLPQTLPWIPPNEAIAKWRSNPPNEIGSLAQQVMSNSIRLHHPRFLGHQISPPAPLAAVFSLLVDLVNNGMGVYEMGMAGTAIEQMVVETLVEKFGLPAKTAGGFMTSGGSLANLTAMLAARSIKSDQDVWNQGIDRPSAILISSAAHYCMDRAIRIMGSGKQGLIEVPVNDRYQMRTDLLESRLKEARQKGLEVLAVVGSACCTATGTYDDLHAIGKFCQRNNLWFHVDGAHGGAVAFSPTHRHLLRGIEMADSITLDFHKMLMTPALASALVFRDHRNAYQTFSQKAEYLWADATIDPNDVSHFDLAKQTFECTKQMFALKFYAILQCHGVETLAANIDRLHLLAEHFSQLVTQADDFELAVQPQSNIVCFRYTAGAQESELNELNERLRQKLVEQGTYYMVQTKLEGRSWLRVTIGNALTTSQHLVGLLEHLRELAASA